MRRSATMFGCGRPGAKTALAALIGLCVAIGCATPEQRYRTLRIFFDNVPLPPSMNHSSKSDSASQGLSLDLAG